MIVIIWPLLVVVVGALVWFAAKDKVSELGRIAFFCGLFWVVWLLTDAHFRLR